MQGKTKWKEIERQFGTSKKEFGKRINFIKPNYKREVIFRDIDHAFGCYQNGFYKPAVVLAGGVIEELLRCYLESKGINPKNKTFNNCIEVCRNNKELIQRPCLINLSNSVRDFRNLVHLEKEESKRYAISGSTAIGAISAVFTVANDFH